jgi:hypothetical protein
VLGPGLTANTGSVSFLKKRSKKLLSIGFPIAYGVYYANYANEMSNAGGNSKPSAKIFLVFLQKRTTSLHVI